MISRVRTIEADHTGCDHDAAGNRLYRDNVLEAGQDYLYSYDGLSRLVDAKRGTLNGAKDAITGTPAAQQGWSLDQLGNWLGFEQKASGSTTLDQTREHNKANEIDDIDQATGPQWVIPGYDAAGNMTVAPAPGPGFAETTEHRYIYDAWNRLVRVTDDQDVTLAGYEYDGLDRRIERRQYSGGQLQRTLHDYFSDRWQLLEVRIDSQTDPMEQHSVERYVWGIHYIDAPLCRDRDSDDDGELDERVYYLTDANMNVTALVDTAGAVLERYRYDAYGQATVLEANWTPDGDGVSDYDNAILFAGYRHDAESGLYHVRYRMYHPTLGRWMQRDPIGYTDGVNLYEYVQSSPLRHVDPLGLCSAGDCDAQVLSMWTMGKDIRFETDHGRSLGIGDILARKLPRRIIDALDKADAFIDVLKELFPFLNRIPIDPALITKTISETNSRLSPGTGFDAAMDLAIFRVQVEATTEYAYRYRRCECVNGAPQLGRWTTDYGIVATPGRIDSTSVTFKLMPSEKVTINHMITEALSLSVWNRFPYVESNITTQLGRNKCSNITVHLRPGLTY